MPRSRRFQGGWPAAGCLAVAAAVVLGGQAISPAAASTATASTATASPAHPPPSIAARAAELANAITGKQLWGRRQYSQRPIASITKVMTALVVVRSGHLRRRIRITAADEQYARDHNATSRSEERRVGKECRTRWSPYH